MSFKKMYLIPQSEYNHRVNNMNENKQFDTNQPINSSLSSIDTRLKNILESNLDERDKIEIFKSIISGYKKKSEKHDKTVVKLSRKKITPIKKISRKSPVKKPQIEQRINEDFPAYKWTKY